MAIYHLHAQIIGRSAGRSVIAAIAYRAGVRIEDQETGIVADYTRKGGVIYSEIQLCENAPAEYADRATLWGAVQKIEKSKDAQLAREVEVALPKELSEAEWRQMIRNYVQDNFVSQGMCADWSIHHPDKEVDNPHCHILLTTRAINPDGTWATKEKKAYALDENGNRIPVIDPKTGQQKIGSKGRKMWKRETVQANDWNSPEKLKQWREGWAVECNRWIDHYNERVHEPEEQISKIDHRSYADQGIVRIPQQHVGVHAQAAANKQKRYGEPIAVDRFNDRIHTQEINRQLDLNKITKRSLTEQIREATQRMLESIRERIVTALSTRVNAARERISGMLKSLAQTRSTGATLGGNASRTYDLERYLGTRDEIVEGLAAEADQRAAVASGYSWASYPPILHPYLQEAAAQRDAAMVHVTERPELIRQRAELGRAIVEQKGVIRELDSQRTKHAVTIRRLEAEQRRGAELTELLEKRKQQQSRLHDAEMALKKEERRIIKRGEALMDARTAEANARYALQRNGEAIVRILPGDRSGDPVKAAEQIVKTYDPIQNETERNAAEQAQRELTAMIREHEKKAAGMKKKDDQLTDQIREIDRYSTKTISDDTLRQLSDDSYSVTDLDERGRATFDWVADLNQWQPEGLQRLAEAAVQSGETVEQIMNQVEDLAVKEYKEFLRTESGFEPDHRPSLDELLERAERRADREKEERKERMSGKNSERKHGRVR